MVFIRQYSVQYGRHERYISRGRYLIRPIYIQYALYRHEKVYESSNIHHTDSAHLHSEGHLATVEQILTRLENGTTDKKVSFKSGLCVLSSIYLGKGT